MINVIGKISAGAIYFCLVANVSLGIAAAQEGLPVNAADQSYPLEYFSQYNPQTARDLIDRIPGFNLVEGTAARGFGSTAGNVLIDGDRPSSKSGGIDDALRRIPAESVERIDLIRGSAGSGEAAGQSVVANIIRRASTGLGTWEARLERSAHGKLNLGAELSVTKTLGDWETSSKISGIWNRKPIDGIRTSRDAERELLSTQSEDRPSDFQEFAFSGEASRPLGQGDLTLNGRVRHSPFTSFTERFRFDGRQPDGSPDERRTIEFDSPLTEVELGADWSRHLPSDWTFKALSLSSYKEIESEQRAFSERPVGTELDRSLFSRREEAFETVLRSTLSKAGNVSLKPEFGAEIAYNQLDSALALQVEDPSGLINIELPTANVSVNELRGEAFANLIWQASDKVTVETGIAAELSDISVSGDAENSQSFFFAKPFATLIYNARPGMQMRFGARRSVGQLDFSDFAASASASDDRLTGGNPELGPDQTTRLFVIADLRSEDLGAINIEVFHEWRDDILEQIILPSGAQGVGNAGSAQVWGVTTSASLPLDRFIPGGLIEVEAEFLDSSFADPLIQMDRSVSSLDSPTIVVDFRQDLTALKLAWGVSYRAPSKGPFFFVDEISRNADGEKWTAFVETTRFFGVKSNLEFSAIGRQDFSRERLFFAPDRSGEFSGSELIDTYRGVVATLTVSGQF